MRPLFASAVAFAGLVAAVQAAPTVSERIDQCRQTAIKQITDQTQPYTSPRIEARAHAGTQNLLAGCERNEDHRSLAFAPPAGYAFENMSVHPAGNWENASFDNVSWSSTGTTGELKVNGHGCDRRDDAVAQAEWTGTIRRILTPQENDQIWQTCIDQETKK